MKKVLGNRVGTECGSVEVAPGGAAEGEGWQEEEKEKDDEEEEEAAGNPQHQGIPSARDPPKAGTGRV